MELCVSKEILNIPTTFSNNLSRTECIKIKKEIDGILDSWKISVKHQISKEMENISECLDAILRCKMRHLLVLFQRILCKNSAEMTDIEKWILNGLLLGKVEQNLHLFDKKSTKYQRKEAELTNIKTFFSQSAEVTFKTIEKQRCYERYLKAKRENISDRCGKVMYYLRNFYVNRNAQCAESVPTFIVELLCGYDPQDEDVDVHYCKKVHSKLNCINKLYSYKRCSFEHFDFVSLAYDMQEPEYFDVYSYIVASVAQSN